MFRNLFGEQAPLVMVGLWDSDLCTIYCSVSHVKCSGVLACASDVPSVHP